MLQLEVGTLAAWVGSVGTVLTLALGVGIFAREVRDNRKRQASRVAAWIDADAGRVRLKNAGEEPITRVMLALFSAPDHYVEPFSGQTEPPWVMSWEWLGPSETATFAPSPVDWTSHLFPPQIRLEFTDATNRRWLRDERGKLRRRRVLPHRQDLRLAPVHRKNEKATEQARRGFTRWRWPNV